MAKKKKNYISIKKQLIVVTGLVALLTLFGLFIGWADSTPLGRFTKTKSSFSGVTIKGESVCLPHRNTDGPQTMECAQGIKTSDGTYYAVSGVVNRSEDNTLEVTGTLVQASGKENYAIAGTITAK